MQVTQQQQPGSVGASSSSCIIKSDKKTSMDVMRTIKKRKKILKSPV